MKAVRKRWLRWGDGARPGPEAPGVLMVCTGNICRSPTAEAVLRARLAAAGIAGRVRVDSAGTHGFHTEDPPDPRAQQAARRRGYDLSALRARPVGAQDFGRFDWILGMDESHRAWLDRRRPEGSRAQIGLLMAHASRHQGVDEVPDPYYGPAQGFETMLDLIEDACEGLARFLAEELSAAGQGREEG